MVDKKIDFHFREIKCVASRNKGKEIYYLQGRKIHLGQHVRRCLVPEYDAPTDAPRNFTLAPPSLRAPTWRHKNGSHHHHAKAPGAPTVAPAVAIAPRRPSTPSRSSAPSMVTVQTVQTPPRETPQIHLAPPAPHDRHESTLDEFLAPSTLSTTSPFASNPKSAQAQSRLRCALSCWPAALSSATASSCRRCRRQRMCRHR